MRRDTSNASCALNSAGALRALLSIWIATSAWLRLGRLPVPEKITSSMSAARSDLCDVSPITQRSASTRFDLPQPFGPTTPVRHGSMRKSVGSTKDLKPSRRSRVSFMPALSRNCRARPERIAQGSGPWCGSRNAASNRRMNRQPRLRNRMNELCICGSGFQGADGLPRTQIRSTEESEKPLSALEIGGELLVQLLSGEPAADDLAVDEKSGRRIHSELC